MKTRIFKFLYIYFMFKMIHICLTDQDGTTENTEEDLNDDETAANTEEIQHTTFPIPDDKWVSNALKDIAYYLRNYKFNEWDRRYNHEKPSIDKIGYQNAFPIPALRSLHWKVYENCYENFHKCITYLHSVIEMSPITRGDDTSSIIHDNAVKLNESQLMTLDKECKISIANAEKSALPFDGPIEKFQWRTSASYYMCWYTMLETPAMAMLGEQCDNFAYCLDPSFGYQNHDPRADDRVPYACATYSFCPDPCCPVKHIESYSKCFDMAYNPCNTENLNEEPVRRICSFLRLDNQNFQDIVTNRWNISCHCNENGFIWKSAFGMCVDRNECVVGEHDCDKETQDCLNVPGSFKCICKWGYVSDSNKINCIKRNVFQKNKFSLKDQYFSFKGFIKRILKYFRFK